MNKTSFEKATEAANKITAQLTGQFKLPPSNVRKKLSIPLKPKLTPPSLGGYIFPSPAAKVIGSEQKPRHLTAGQLPDGIELLNNNSYVFYRCMFCDVKLTSVAILSRHIEGSAHLKKLQLKQDCGEKVLQNAILSTPKSTLDKYLADISQPVVGFDFVEETQLPGKQPSFFCKLCGITCDINEIREHIIGVRHCLMYLQMVESKRMEEIRNQFKKKSERNQEILKFAAQVEKQRGRGTVKLILSERPPNEETCKKTEHVHDEEKKNNDYSLKRIDKNSPNQERKRPSLSKDIYDFTSDEKGRYHDNNYPNTRQHDECEEEEKQAKTQNRKHNSEKLGSAGFDIASNNPASSFEESNSSHTTNVKRTTRTDSLPSIRKHKTEAKRPLYKPPRTFQLPSDVVKEIMPFMKDVPNSRSTEQLNSMKDAMTSLALQHQSEQNVSIGVSRTTGRLNTVKSTVKPPMSYQKKSRTTTASDRSSSTEWTASQHHPINNRLKPAVSQYFSKQNRTTPPPDLSNSINNAMAPIAFQHQPVQSNDIAKFSSEDTVRRVSEHLITGYLNQSELKGPNETDISALQHLSSFVIADDDDAGNVIDVLNSLVQTFLQYKTQALTDPVRNLLCKSLMDGSEGLESILKHHGVENIKPLEKFSEINNATTRCASNVLRQFYSKWKEETDMSPLTNKSDSSFDHSLSSLKNTTTLENELAYNFPPNESQEQTLNRNIVDKSSKFEALPYILNENRNPTSLNSEAYYSFRSEYK